MTEAIDLLLPLPLSAAWLQGLLFTAFFLHLLFVLFALGTAFIAVCCYVQVRCLERREEERLDRRILKSFLAHKSLAVVLGVAPLLLIQVGRTVPIFTAINILAPFWLLLIVLLIVAFVFFDVMGHATHQYRRIHFAIGLVALAALLAVPGIFVALLTTAENPARWSEIVSGGYRLTGLLAMHWLARYLHVLGAAVVFGAFYHYFFSAETAEERSVLLQWVIAGMLLQIVFGVSLFASLTERPDVAGSLLLLAAVLAATLLLWLLFTAILRQKTLSFRTLVPLSLAMLVLMLLTRQSLQDRGMLPLIDKAHRKAVAYQARLAPYLDYARADYRAAIGNISDSGDAIYAGSCAFCHGEKADGGGAEAASLSVPPEQISELRTARLHLYELISAGVRGSGMPYFSFYDRQKLESLITMLDQRYHVLRKPEPVPKTLIRATPVQSAAAYREACSACHGVDGRGSTQANNFQPPPPDFSRYSLTPRRTFEVITAGYPGTMMTSHAALPEDIRWGLVTHLQTMRKE